MTVAGAKPIIVRLSGGYNLAHLDRLVRDLSPLLALDEPRVFHMDLQGLAFMGPTAVALLVATLRRLQDLGFVPGDEECRIFMGRPRPVVQYLERMDLLRALAVESEERFRRKKAVGFRPCQHFIGDHDYPGVASDLTAALVERVKTDSMARAAIRICLDELAENVVHHAYTPLGGFAAAQGWPKRSEFEIGIVDLGVGIRGSLTRNPDYAAIEDDVTAIATAMEPRISATPERNAGIGLFVTKMLLRENGGLLLVRSGTGAVYAGSRNDALDRGIQLPGTLVALRARTDKPLDLGPVYRRLDDGHADHDD